MNYIIGVKTVQNYVVNLYMFTEQKDFSYGYLYKSMLHELKGPVATYWHNTSELNLNWDKFLKEFLLRYEPSSVKEIVHRQFKTETKPIGVRAEVSLSKSIKNSKWWILWLFSDIHTRHWMLKVTVEIVLPQNCWVVRN